MKFLYGVLLVAGVFVFSNASVTLKRIATDKLLISNMPEPRASNPNNVVPCFSYYNPIFTEILDEYEKSYDKCSTDFKAKTDSLELQAQGNQTLISESAQNVSSTMADCSALNDTLEFLDCYSSVGNGNMKALYVLTNNATDVATSLREQNRVIENEMGVCQNACHRAYMENTNRAKDDLNLCFDNGVPTTPKPEHPTTEPATKPTTAEPKTKGPEASEKEDPSRIAGFLSANQFNRLNRNYQH